MAGSRESFRPSGKLSSLDSEQYPDEVIVDLDGKDPDAFEIVEEDDTPEADRGKPRELEYSEADNDEPIDGVSAKTKKRIDRLKYETNTERRAREAAERERDAAVTFARNQNAELDDLRRRVSGGNTALAASMKEGREAKLADAKRRLSAAHADGDSDAIAAATSDISQAQAELLEIQRNTPRAQPAGEERRPVQTQQQQAPNLEPNVAKWIANNSWFGTGQGKDANRTRFAISVDQSLRARGVDPNSDDYLRELDKGVKAMYSDHKPLARANGDDEDESRREVRRTNVQTEGGRTNDRQESSRKVALTASELAIAKRLGLTPQAYAVEKLKMASKAGAGA